jgi:hypothetical protein
MKTNIILTAFLIFISANIFGQEINGSGNIIKEDRTFSKFSGVELKNSANVYITQGKEQSFRIEGEDNIISHITTKIKDSELRISTDDQIRPTKNINIYITVTDLSILEVKGSGNIKTSNEFKCNDMILRLTGSGNISATLDSKSLSLELTGSGNIDLEGQTNKATMSVSGSGNVASKDLKSVNNEISITGSGNCTVDVKNNLNVLITGSGSVYYLTDPESIRGTIKGSGKILLMS